MGAWEGESEGGRVEVREGAWEGELELENFILQGLKEGT